MLVLSKVAIPKVALKMKKKEKIFQWTVLIRKQFPTGSPLCDKRCWRGGSEPLGPPMLQMHRHSTFKHFQHL